MKIKMTPTISEPIYLQALSLEIAAMEGEIPQTEQAWVKVRQATEQDHIARADLMARKEMQFGSAYSEFVEDNPRERMMYEVYWTLYDLGNLVDESGDPLFSTRDKEGRLATNMPANSMPFAQFQEVWGKLERFLTAAIYMAVLKANPDWDYRQGKV